ncbi:hypothetical protein BWQ96_01826 [Gracilariopsis chorda]|uniref:Nucleoporin NDC1 n=1 Tax=Gracilariopsis chorda TaxID=448386 RepID=A0A2V3J1R5_9FLOR|nr:hypothetical protein BWQ96_01826 [Gracilariopsis chorda]|eukprot:PXF48366.1 hypothetical protein BWQ96_01826 [Gracilariopsis chorda]
MSAPPRTDAAVSRLTESLRELPPRRAASLHTAVVCRVESDTVGTWRIQEALDSAAWRTSAASFLLASASLTLSRSASCPVSVLVRMLQILAFALYVAVIVGAEAALSRARPLIDRRRTAFHAVATAALLVVQSVLHSFITQGTSLSAVCAEGSVLPSAKHMLPSVMLALLCAPAYTLLVRELHSSFIALRPFPSLFWRVRALAPRMLVLSAAPPLAALLPVLVFSAGVMRSVSTAVYSVWSAFQAATMSLLVWNLMQGVTNIPRGLSLAEAREEAGQLSKPGVVPGGKVLLALRTISLHEAQLSSFVGFTDASGEAWRAALGVLLEPLNRMTNILRAHNSSAKVPLLVQAGLGGGGGGVVSGATVVDESVAVEAVAACKTLAILFVKSYKVDVYGVVQRTLPATLACVLKLKEESDKFVKGGAQGEGQHVLWQSLKNVMGVSCQRRLVEVVDDEVVRCAYAIVARFSKFVSTFLAGKELEWDRSADGALSALLQFGVP